MNLIVYVIRENEIRLKLINKAESSTFNITAESEEQCLIVWMIDDYIYNDFIHEFEWSLDEEKNIGIICPGFEKGDKELVKVMFSNDQVYEGILYAEVQESVSKP